MDEDRAKLLHSLAIDRAHAAAPKRRPWPVARMPIVAGLQS